MSDYKPGDVAMVTAYNRREPYRAYFDGKTWREHGADCFCVDVPTSIVPLVVLDLDERDPRRVAADLTAAIEATGNGQVSQRLRTLRNQFEAQTKPPKPAEPRGLGAVVEDSEGVLYILANPRGIAAWIIQDAGADGIDSPYRVWRQIDAVRVLSEGVTL